MPTRRYIDANFSIFEFIGASQTSFVLNKEAQRMLGFIAVNSVDALVIDLVLEAFVEEMDDGEVEVDLEKMLDFLKNNPSGRFFNLTSDEIIKILIQDFAQEMNEDIEKEHESNQGRRVLKELLSGRPGRR